MSGKEFQKVKPTAVANDLVNPTAEILRDINLLPAKGAKLDGFGAAFTGPPDSVALIEAGLTAAAKWWSATGAGLTVGIWGVVRVAWNNIPENSQPVLIWTAAIVSAALVLAIGWLLSMDLRGRAIVQAATVAARAGVAEAMVQLGGQQSDLSKAVGRDDGRPDRSDPVDSQHSRSALLTISVVELPERVDGQDRGRPTSV